MIRRTVTNIEQLQILQNIIYNIKINLPENRNSKTHDDEVIISCKKCLKWTYGIFGHNHRVTMLSIFFLTVSRIIISSLKLIGQF